MKKLFIIILLLCALLPALAEEAEESVYTLYAEDGDRLTRRFGAMYEGDEYIASDNSLFEIISVDNARKTAVARYMGKEPEDALETFGALNEKKQRLICMYSTQSDESYIPGDGDFSLLKNAGIYDVGDAFQKHLEDLGYTVEYSRETFLPHDAGAYRRSRSVVADYVKKTPDAIIDIHRDGIPADEYETTVNGEKASMVRLFVGKSNQNASANRAFAKQLKAIGDKEYPGLIKDIYIGKGNYNQDLYPQAILLEFGTHKIDKELAIRSTEYMANVVNTALGHNGKAGIKNEKSAGAKNGILITLAAAAAIAVVLCLVSTGSLKGAGRRLASGARELTGSIFSKKHK